MSQPTTKGCNQTISRNKLVTHTIWLDAITWKILSCLPSKQPERKPLLHGNMLQLTSVHRVVFNTNWKRKLNTICHLFSPRFPFPLLSKGCADFQYTLLHSTRPTILLWGNLKSQKNRENALSAELSRPCVHGRILYSCAVKIMVFASFFFFLRCVFKRTHRW